MLLVCAWCERESGSPSVIRTVPPLDDERSTHGICDRHAVKLLLVALDAQRRRGDPTARLLLIVSRERGDVRDWLACVTAGEPGVTIVTDRRIGERREPAAPPVVDRRRGERRNHVVAEQLSTSGWCGIVTSELADA